MFSAWIISYCPNTRATVGKNEFSRSRRAIKGEQKENTLIIFTKSFGFVCSVVHRLKGLKDFFIYAFVPIACEAEMTLVSTAAIDSVTH